MSIVHLYTLSTFQLNLNCKTSGINLSRLSGCIKGSIRRDSDGLSRAEVRSHPSDVMTKGLHERNGGVIVGVLKFDHIWNQLIVETRLSQGVVGCHLLIDGVNDVLERRCDDPTASCCAGDEERAAVGAGSNDWGDG